MTVHPADFFDSHRRHWEDAEMLYSHRCWSNADQFYGFSAECGLKAVMNMLGMRFPGGNPPQKYQEHVKKLWPLFKTFARGRNGARYLSMLPRGEPFGDWSHHNRYAHRRHFSENYVKPHRVAARRIRTMIQRAKLSKRP